MAQIVDIPYNPTSSAEPLSQSINRHFQNLFPAGPYSGLYPQAGETSGKVTITAGYAITAEGCRVLETANLVDKLTITPNESAWPRWDAIVLRHQYQAVYPMPAAYYDSIEGTPASSPAYPAVLPDDATLLGHAYLPAGAANYSWGDVYAPAPRRHDNWRIVTVAGLGAARPGDYNGDKGLVAALADLKDTGGIILLSGIFLAANLLDIPAGVELVGVGWAEIVGLAAGGTIRLLGRGGSATLGSGDSTLPDPLADFNLYGLKSVVYIDQIGGDDVSGFYLARSKTETTLTLVGGPFAGQSCYYYVLNTAKLRNIRLTNMMDANCATLQHTFMSRFEECMFRTGGSACGVLGEDTTQTWHTTFRRCHFDCGGRAIDLSNDQHGLIEGCEGEGAIRIRHGGSISRIVGNPGMTVEQPTGAIPQGGAQVGDPSFPFNVEHSPQGVHTKHEERTVSRYGYAVWSVLVAAASSGQNEVEVAEDHGSHFSPGDLVWLRGLPTTSAEYNVVASVDGDVITLTEDLQWSMGYDPGGGNYSIISVVKNLDVSIDGRDRLISARGFIAPQITPPTYQPGEASDGFITGYIRPEGTMAKAKSMIHACKYSAQGVHPVGAEACGALEYWLELYDNYTSWNNKSPKGRIIVAQQTITIDSVTYAQAGDLLLLNIGATDEAPSNFAAYLNYFLIIGLSPQTGVY